MAAQRERRPADAPSGVPLRSWSLGYLAGCRGEPAAHPAGLHGIEAESWYSGHDAGERFGAKRAMALDSDEAEQVRAAWTSIRRQRVRDEADLLAEMA